MMDTIEFKKTLDEIMNILTSCALVTNPKLNECCICNNEIKENESDARCDCCSKHFHVTCMGFPCEDRLSDLTLIWICSFCGNNNMAHRMFDQVCIPSHFNRYELLGDHDEHCYLDLNQSRTLSSTTNKRKCGRSKKRSRICESTEFMLVARKKKQRTRKVEQGTRKKQSRFPDCNGHSVVLRTQSWQGVYKHCMRLAKSMGCPLHTEYEVTSVCAKATSD
ncbi:uncharacterized protein LOC115924976 isoform X4 [Strongylocentrotus purpuratus]|uniref:PHD-type domain-containing protein n=1 Tax=Strongylocentrotus purpuratus TaxID=7668 RepID=A0A7M7P1R7_STRPU|nr:uncharacterized protein LOC115924976 isoform X4 [Strongylocentrotus purpuratus]